jgi:hypothetical protein
MVFLHGDYFLQLRYDTPIAQELEKRSTNGNGGLSGGEIGGLIVGIIGIFLTALTVYISWKWRSVSIILTVSIPEDANRYLSPGS